MTKYNRPIEKVEFWRERIKGAPSPHYAVYSVHDREWKRINDVHRQIVEKEITPTSGTVLDLACGYGRMNVLFPSNYQGVDFSPDFIAQAKELYPKRASDFMVADLRVLPFEVSSVDWGLLVSVKRMFVDNLGEEEWEKVFKEITRVCKNVLILEYEDPENYEVWNLGYAEYKTI